MRRLSIATPHQMGLRRVYSAAIHETSAKGSLVGSFIDRVFDGSTRNMVLHALAAREVDDEVLAEIQQIIESLEKLDDPDTQQQLARQAVALDGDEDGCCLTSERLPWSCLPTA